MKPQKIIASIIGITMVVPLMTIKVMADSDEIAIDKTNFPDSVFRQYVLDKIDTDGNGKLSQNEIENVYEIDVRRSDESQSAINSLKGIEFFTGVYELYCSNNQISSIDLSHFTSLESIDCSGNQLTNIDISTNESLERMDCSNNKLSSIDVSNNTSLYTLKCSNNQLSSLDVKSNVGLEILLCSNNKLSSLDISTNAKLKELNFSNNPITNIDISNNKNLTRLFSADTQITSLEINNNTALKSLNCYNNSISHLDIRNNTQLTQLVVDEENFNLDYINSAALLNAYHDGNRYEFTSGEYQESLDRNITVFTDSTLTWNEELKAWVSNKLNFSILGIVSANSQSEDVSSSEETSGVYGFAERLYTCALNRASEQAGKDYWVDALHHGTSGADAAYGFLFSAEVENANLDDKTFINRLYVTLMDREPADVEVEYWRNEITAGRMTRQDVFWGFINSEEWANVCVTYGILSGGTGVPSITVEPSQSIVDFATRLYTTCLNRDPDSAGLEWWANELANLRTTGSAAAKSYFFSDEFIKGNVNDREFVKRLYLTFMNRNAAEVEFDYWLGEMSNGMSRETVFSGFAGSEEFGNICAEYGIIR